VRRMHPVPPCPPRLSAEGSPGAKERARAIEHFAAEEGKRAGTFQFNVYKHGEIRQALLDAFARVCAYCEAPIAAVEVEHYRPKAAVRTAGGQRSPGYFWLAATWENLLPSCYYCNTERWPDYGEGPRYKSGKGNWFPLEDEHARATRPGGEDRERPLLLHPYYDDPSEHLEFVDEGVVRARRGADGRPSPRGEATIRILGLNRRGLPEHRRDRLLALRVARDDALAAQHECQARPGDDELARTYDRCVAELGRLVRPYAGYSGLTAQFLGLTTGAMPNV
jgi:uncharacterized protein (TIGR02646 family)